jgi:hypothetical protein
MDHNFERAFTRQRPGETIQTLPPRPYPDCWGLTIHHQAFYGRRMAKVRNSGENYQCLKDVLCAYTEDR